MGNPGKRVLKDDAPEFDLPADLKAPAYLRDDAVDFWEEAAGQLHEKGLLTVPDIPSLVIYCNNLAKIVEAERMMAVEGSVIAATENHGPYTSPWFKQQKDAEKIVFSYANKFGFNPAARLALKMNPPNTKMGLLIAMKKEAAYGHNTRR